MCELFPNFEQFEQLYKTGLSQSRMEFNFIDEKLALIRDHWQEACGKVFSSHYLPCRGPFKISKWIEAFNELVDRVRGPHQQLRRLYARDLRKLIDNTSFGLAFVEHLDLIFDRIDAKALSQQPELYDCLEYLIRRARLVRGDFNSNELANLFDERLRLNRWLVIRDAVEQLKPLSFKSFIEEHYRQAFKSTLTDSLIEWSCKKLKLLSKRLDTFF